MSDLPTIPREVLALAHFASSDDSRPVLSGVRVNETEAVASDGYTVAEVALASPLLVLTGRTLMKRAALKLLTTVRKATRFAEYSQIAGDGLGETFLAVVKQQTPREHRLHKEPLLPTVVTKTLFEAREIPQAFPAYSHFLPVPDDAAMVALSPKVLSQLVDAVEALGAPFVRLYVRGPQDQVVFRIHAGGETWIRGAVMPMACSWEVIP